jgi:hypothetical protein
MYGMTHQKALNTGIIASILLVAAILTTTTTTATNVQASNNNDNSNCSEKEVIGELLCGLDEAATGYTEGVKDGKQAALNRQSNECPQSDDFSGYCLGFGSGWNKINNAQNDLNEAKGNDGDNDNEDDENQTPKRTIGGSN